VKRSEKGVFQAINKIAVQLNHLINEILLAHKNSDSSGNFHENPKNLFENLGRVVRVGNIARFE